ncbi:MAG: hypothetical protein ACXU82_01070 [Caulobacteraceae bacterium]
MNVLHILNVADWALMAAGLAATLLMILVGGHDDGPRNEKKADRQVRRPSKAGQ